MKRGISVVILIVLLFAGLVQAKDLRATKLKKFLDRYPWSPLRGHEQEILYCADKFGLDFRLYIAIAGAESSYGKRFPKSSKNLTGYAVYDDNVGSFNSIWHNIYETSKLIATSNYYKKFRKTRDIKDLIFVYKGVPPYDHYYNNMRYALDQITRVSIVRELKEQREKLVRLDPASKRLMGKREYVEKMFAWTAVRYDKHTVRKVSEAGLKFAAK
ncbi:MAG: hypothetical protein KJ732_06910 [Candidatus Margulisbacteria bacterium]|nr:hypothetical protein [Candidatus Margulisiibacteriota bacterium]